MRLLICGLIAFGTMPGAAAASAGEADDPAPMTLAEVLVEARAANARLPVANLDVQIALQRRREADARRRIQIRLEGDLQVAPAPGYDPVVTNLGEDRLQIALEKPLYDGGALRAGAAQARAESLAAAARFRMEEQDLELEVRQQYAGVLAADREVEARREGLGRLVSYLSLLEDRARAGQAVAPDLLRTRVRLASERVALIAAEGAGDEAAMGLNGLMGRDPGSRLRVASLPPPAPPARVAPDAWRSAPDLVAAGHDIDAAEAARLVAEAERRWQVTARVDAGLWGSDTTRLVPGDYAASHPGAGFADRLNRDLGYSFALGVGLPLFDSGAIAARIAVARLTLDQARQRLAVEQANARRQLALAERELERAYRQYQLLTEAQPQARDAYLEAESRYRGGTSSYLEVLDAFSATVDTAVEVAQAELAYRIAQALALRWGGTI